MSEAPNATKARIIQLPGAVRTPETLLHQIIDEVDGIESVAIVVLWKAQDGECPSADAYWSNMQTSELTFVERALHERVSAAVNGPCPHCCGSDG